MATRYWKLCGLTLAVNPEQYVGIFILLLSKRHVKCLGLIYAQIIVSRLFQNSGLEPGYDRAMPIPTSSHLAARQP